MANQFDADRTAREKAYVKLARPWGRDKRRGKADEKLKTTNEDIARPRTASPSRPRSVARGRRAAAAMNGYVEKLGGPLRRRCDTVAEAGGEGVLF